MSYSFGAAGDCAENETYDATVDACLCSNGFQYSIDANACVPTGSSNVGVQNDCLASGGRWINGVCTVDCPSGYGWDVTGKCVKLSDYDDKLAQAAAAVNSGASNAVATVKASMASNPLLWVAGGVAVVALFAATRKPSRQASPNRRRRRR